MIALMLIVVLVALILLRVPVSFAILATGLFGLLLLLPVEGVGGVMEAIPIGSVQSLSLTAIPLFILMAHFMLMSGMMDSLFGAGRTIFGRTPGGTGIASAMAGVGFSAVSGSSTAAAATLSKTTISQLIDEGYKPTTATGMVASVGTLAGMIPPSVILVFYAVTAEASVGDMIVAGIVPGIIIAIALLLAMIVPSLFGSGSLPRGERATMKDKMSGIVAASPILLIFGAVVGAIYFGIASPTESASLGVLAAFILVVARRKMTVEGFIHSLIDTIKTSSMILAIVIAAHVFGYAFTMTKTAQDLVEWIGSLTVPTILIMLAITVFYLILGFFMDQIAIVALTVPIVLPLVEVLGYDAIWFGVFVVLMGEIGLITPPLGINVFVVARTAGRNTLEVFRGAVPYVCAMLVVAVAFLIWPEIVMWLPNSM